MPEINDQNGMLNAKPKRKGRADINWPPITNDWPNLERGDIPRPPRIESVSVADLANYVVHYQEMFSDEVIDNFNDEAWILSLGYRLTAIVTKFYNGSALARGSDSRLCREMVDELTADGGGYEFFRKFAGNWFAYKLLQLRYKTHRYQRDRAARGIARSTQRPEGRTERHGRKIRLPDKVKDSNPGGRAVSQLSNRPGRPLTLAQMRYCCGCVEFKDPKDSKNTRYEACGRHRHDNSGMMINHRERERSTLIRNSTSDSGHTVVPSDDSSDDDNNNAEGDSTQWNDSTIVTDIVDVESDKDTDHNNGHRDSSDTLRQHRALSTRSWLSSTSDDSLRSPGRRSRYERSLDKEDDERDDGEDGPENGGEVEGNLDEVNTETSVGQLQQESVAQLVQKIIEQEDTMRVMRAALDRSSQQLKRLGKAYRRQLPSTTQPSHENQRNPLRDESAQQSRSREQRETSHRVSKSPTPTQLTRNSRLRQEKSQIEPSSVASRTRPRHSSQLATPAAASALNDTRPRTRSKRPLSNTNHPLPSGRS